MAKWRNPHLWLALAVLLVIALAAVLAVSGRTLPTPQHSSLPTPGPSAASTPTLLSRAGAALPWVGLGIVLTLALAGVIVWWSRRSEQ